MLRLSRAAAGGALLLPLVLAACTSGAKSSYPPPPRVMSGRPSPSPQVLTGTHLKGLLVTDVRKGFTADPQVDQTTGDQLGTASTGPEPTTAGCAKLADNDILQAAGITSLSSASLGFVTADKSGRISEQVAEFAGSDAPAVMRRLDQAFQMCKTYTTTGSGKTRTVHMTASKAPMLGMDAVKAHLTFAHSGAQEILVAARVGTAVVAVAVAGGGPDKTLDDYAMSLTQQIMRNVQAAL